MLCLHRIDTALIEILNGIAAGQSLTITFLLNGEIVTVDAKPSDTWQLNRKESFP